MQLKLLSTVAIAVCTCAALLISPVFAADAPAAGSTREICAADFAKFCVGKEQRSEEGRACSREHRAEFSEPCRNAIEARRRERSEKLKAACGPEIAKFCNASSATGEGAGRCLREHQAELSQTCKAAVPNRGA